MASKRGAKPVAPIEQTAALNGELMDERRQQVAEMNTHTRAVIDQFGDGLPWHPDHYEAAIRVEIGRSAESFLRAGRLLLVARECSAHGEWQAMLERLGLERPAAQVMMAWARQIAAVGNVARVQHLTEAAGTIGKMIELSRLPPEQFKALAEDGQAGDLEIDDLADMTRDELRSAVRKARDEIETRDMQIDTLKDERTRARREWVKTAPNARITKLRAHVRAAADAMILPLSPNDASRGLHGAIVTLVEDEDAAQQDHTEFLAGVFQELLGLVCLVRDNLPVSVPILENRAPKLGKR